MNEAQNPQQNQQGSPFSDKLRSSNGRLWIVLLLIGGFLLWSWYMRSMRVTEISYTEFRNQVQAGNVEKVTVQGERIEGTLGSKATKQVGEKAVEYKQFLTHVPSFGDDQLLGMLEKHNVQVNTEPKKDMAFWYLILTFLPFLLLIWFVYMQYKRFQSQSGGIFSIGKSQAKQYDRSEVETTFDDVAGAEGAKVELQEIVSFLKDPERIRDLGADVPKGIMLVGYPGTGKTLLARAVAGEADVPFYSITGSDFMEMFVGVGAKRVRNLFQDAKKDAPSIIFIDEIDAIGRRRGAGLGGGHDEREQTLNQLLSELDGFEPNENVIVMTATNRPDILDPALMRPGRFDRRIMVDLPTTSDREKILEIYARNKKLGDDVDLEDVARGTPGFSGADLRNMLNESALLAARDDRDVITWKDIEGARDKILMGLERHGMTMSEEEKRMVAYHEAGHAIVGALLPQADPVHKVSIIPRSQAMGATQQFPEKEQYIYKREYMQDRLAVMMGGRCAESMVFETATSGAGNDLQNATKLARKMVLDWGMSGRFEHMALGSQSNEVFLGEELGKSREYSEKTAQEVDEEVQKLLQEAYQRTEEVIAKHRSELDKLAEMLIQQEEVPGEEVLRLLGMEPEKEGGARENWDADRNKKAGDEGEADDGQKS
jgi:cell division protease FtsH